MSVLTRPLFALALVVTLVGQTAFAETRSLENVMKDMGMNFGILATALIKHQPADAGSLATAAQALVGLTGEADQILPTQLVDASGQPLPGTADQITKYHELMAQLVTAENKLVATLASGDMNAAALVLTGEIMPIRKQGHDLFKQ